MSLFLLCRVLQEVNTLELHRLLQGCKNMSDSTIVVTFHFDTQCPTDRSFSGNNDQSQLSWMLRSSNAWSTLARLASLCCSNLELCIAGTPCLDSSRPVSPKVEVLKLSSLHLDWPPTHPQHSCTKKNGCSIFGKLLVCWPMYGPCDPYLWIAVPCTFLLCSPIYIIYRCICIWIVQSTLCFPMLN